MPRDGQRIFDGTAAALVRGLAHRVLDPVDVAPLTSEAASIKDSWLHAAYRRAGIDGSTWDPARGLDGANRAAVYAVPPYYAQLYHLDHAFDWSGMASLIAPSFVAGMEDAHQAAGILTRLHSGLAPRATSLERRLMTMQRDIFTDQAVMHEAYLGDGLRGIRQLHRSG